MLSVNMTKRKRDGIKSMARAAWACALALAIQSHADVVFHEGDGTVFEIGDIATYNLHKSEFDVFAKSLSAVPPILNQWFGKLAPAPIRYRITHGGCGVGISGTVITIGDTCIINKWSP